MMNMNGLLPASDLFIDLEMSLSVKNNGAADKCRILHGLNASPVLPSRTGTKKDVGVLLLFIPSSDLGELIERDKQRSWPTPRMNAGTPRRSAVTELSSQVVDVSVAVSSSRK